MKQYLTRFEEGVWVYKATDESGSAEFFFLYGLLRRVRYSLSEKADCGISG
jgi:hypothetical protein